MHVYNIIIPKILLICPQFWPDDCVTRMVVDGRAIQGKGVNFISKSASVGCLTCE